MDGEAKREGGEWDMAYVLRFSEFFVFVSGWVWVCLGNGSFSACFLGVFALGGLLMCFA